MTDCPLPTHVVGVGEPEIQELDGKGHSARGLQLPLTHGRVGVVGVLRAYDFDRLSNLHLAILRQKIS